MVNDLELSKAEEPATAEKPIATKPQTEPTETQRPKVEVPVSIAKQDHMLDDNDMAEEGLKTQDCHLIQRKKGFAATHECGFFTQVILRKEMSSKLFEAIFSSQKYFPAHNLLNKKSVSTKSQK